MATKKILVVDFDQNSLTSVRAALVKEGFDVITASDGQAGWDRYIKESPDLVLMEAMLPKVHGFELCQRITSEKNSRTKVFIMTGVYKDRVYRTEALRTYGASEYYEKPIKMAEVLASIEAVIGKPEARPVPPPAEARLDVAHAAPVAAKPAREIRPEPTPAAPRKHEKPQSDDSIFALPDDLDRLSREMPKSRKPVASRQDADLEPKSELVADELLKSVLVETAAPKAFKPKPGAGNGNGNGGADIDKFLKSALADLDFGQEKVKVPKTAPLPPPPPSIPEKPEVTAEPVKAAEPKPAPPTSPAPPLSVAAPAGSDMKNRLTPGDPGSDVSPFFTPAKLKPFKPVERTEKRPATVRPEPGRQEKALPEPVVLKPLHPEPKAPEAEKPVSAAIFPGLVESKEKKGFPKMAIIGIGIAALAVVGFILLRPKPVAENSREASQAASQTSAPVIETEEASPPVSKPAPVKPKPQPKAAADDNGAAGAEAILPAGSLAAIPPPPKLQPDPGTAGGQTAAGTTANQPVTQPAGTEQAAPPAVEPKVDPPQAAAADAGVAANPGTSTAAPAIAAPPVREGDLVELGTVTEQPRLIKKIEPVYPSSAQRLGVGGSITVNALIDERGRVIDTGILKGILNDPGLGRAAETAVKKWKFEPARKNGVAVKVWKPFVIVFKAVENPANTPE